MGCPFVVVVSSLWLKGGNESGYTRMTIPSFGLLLHSFAGMHLHVISFVQPVFGMIQTKPFSFINYKSFCGTKIIRSFAKTKRNSYENTECKRRNGDEHLVG